MSWTKIDSEQITGLVKERNQLFQNKQNTNIIVKIKGGLVVAVFADNPNVSVDILDCDVCYSEDEEERTRFQRIEAKAERLIPVY